MAVLKQSTAYTRMFMLVQSADHITGLTGASATVNVSKAGGSFGAAGGTVTEVANGWYKIALTTTDTNTLGDLAYHITATSADPTDFVDQVCANILGDAYARLGAPAGASVSADIAAVKADSAAIKTKTDSLTFTVAGMADANVVDWKGATAPAMTGDAYARLGAPVGASISADVAGVPTATFGLSNGIETGYTPKATLRLMFAALCGKVSGLPGSPVFRDVPDTKSRITATTDTDGNRTAVTLDAT